jgi:parallel beta-helix repeat protein
MTDFDVQAAVSLFDVGRGDFALKQALGLSRIYVLTLPSSTNLQEALSAFSVDPAVEYAEPDFVGWGGGTPDDEWFDQQWNLHNTGQSGGEFDADVDAIEAWDISAGVTSTIVSIIDTGVDLDHPDLADKVVPGYDFVNGDATPQDDHGHGTHVAGIAAAVTNDGVGVAGVCPGCRVMPIKALNESNWGYYSWWADAIEYAVDHGAHVINMSMGGTGDSQVLHDAVLYAYRARVPIVAAMMNDGDSIPYYPAVFTETIAVGSTDRYDSRSSFSNFGDHIDLVAPGTSIMSAVWDDGYAAWNGTSMATPHTVGVLGLMHSVRPGYTVEELRDILRMTADDQVGPSNEDKKGWDPYFGSGRLNAARAVQRVVPPDDVTLSGPVTGSVSTGLTFTATVSPTTAAQPITYAWQAAGQPSVLHTGGLSDAVSFTWDMPGTQTVTVAVTNFAGRVTNTHTISISPPPPGTVFTVCHESSCDYDNIQDAVDAAADGVVIKVATGTYTGVNDYGGLSQVVYVSKSVTIRGGYTSTFIDPPDPEGNPTLVDARGGGRVFYIAAPSPSESISPVVEGLRITGGDADKLGGHLGGGDAGGGVFILNAAAIVRDNRILGNVARWGGGLYLRESDAALSGNAVVSNTAAHDGGGLYLEGSDTSLRWNTVISNAAAHDGGGLYLWGSDATLGGNIVRSNVASHGGGGLYLRESDATLVNNVISDNVADIMGGGLCVQQSSPHLLHATIARNGSAGLAAGARGDGSGICVVDSEGNSSTVALTNTILVSQTVGITVTAANTVTLEGTLWGGGDWANVADWGGAGRITTGTLAYNYWGGPAFVNPDAGNYHIHPASAAMDAGVNTGVTMDVDGQPRHQGNGHDIGADEVPVALEVTEQPLPNPVQAGTSLTYAIRVTNTGDVDLHTTVTDTLPAHVRPGVGDAHVWTSTIAAPGGVWTEDVSVTVEMGFAGSLVNVVRVTSREGAADACTSTVTVAEQVITVGPGEGGTIVATSGGGVTTTIDIPPGAVVEPTQHAFTSMPPVAGAPPGMAFAGHAFKLEAYRDGVLYPDLVFQEPVIVGIHYTEADVAGLDESTLELRHWDDGSWSVEGIAMLERDVANNRLVVSVSHLSDFATFAKGQQPQRIVYLPLVLRQSP